MEIQLNDEIARRWENYRLANGKFPDVRALELEKQLEYTSPKLGERIVEIGTGNGILTFELARRVGKGGKIITHDYQNVNLEYVMKLNDGRYPIECVSQALDYGLSLENDSVDRISTIATLHHYDDRSKKTGSEGREEIINEFYRVLKEGGKLVIGDVAHGTAAQKYFDAIDDPKLCYPLGHPHDFLDEKLAKELCSNAGFKNIEFKIESVPWAFKNEEMAGEFLHQIHNAKCSPEESLNVAKKHIPFWSDFGKFYLGWELFYLTAEK